MDLPLLAGRVYFDGRGARRRVMGPTRHYPAWVWTAEGEWYDRATGRHVRYGSGGSYLVEPDHVENLVRMGAEFPLVVLDDGSRIIKPGVMTWPSGKVAPREVVKQGVGGGWGALLAQLIDDLFDLGWNGHVHQVKEKFGGLRFYIGEGSDGVHDRVERAETASFKICEMCGSDGDDVTTAGSWLKTLCAACRDRSTAPSA